ncbi:MAG: SYNERG-CTERM sorting domain-containing protein [Synergistaceae bacterium]|nr:SYNERG-CTERM sorting domain-containing protein [Synergistaceae bacterium]
MVLRGGTPPFTYRWRWSRDAADDGAWQDHQLGKTSFYTHGISLEGDFSDGWYGLPTTRWRCVVTDVTGASVTSETATLTVVPGGDRHEQGSSSGGCGNVGFGGLALIALAGAMIARKRA